MAADWVDTGTNRHTGDYETLTNLHSMEDMFSVQLIEGNFSQEEAREVLSGLLTYKINFHELKRFAHQEQLGREHTASVQRAQALKADKALVLAWLRSIEPGKTIRLESVIQLSVEEP